MSEKTSVVTVIKYDVLEGILSRWLLKEFKGEARYEVCDPAFRETLGPQSLKVLLTGGFREWRWVLEGECPAGDYFGWFSFTGMSDGWLTGNVTQVEQNEMKKKPLKKRRTLEH